MLLIRARWAVVLILPLGFLVPHWLGPFVEEQQAVFGWLFQYMPVGRGYTLELLPMSKQRLWMWRRTWQIIRERQIIWNYALGKERPEEHGNWLVPCSLRDHYGMGCTDDRYHREGVIVGLSGSQV